MKRRNTLPLLVLAGLLLLAFCYQVAGASQPRASAAFVQLNTKKRVCHGVARIGRAWYNAHGNTGTGKHAGKATPRDKLVGCASNGAGEHYPEWYTVLTLHGSGGCQYNVFMYSNRSGETQEPTLTPYVYCYTIRKQLLKATAAALTRYQQCDNGLTRWADQERAFGWQTVIPLYSKTSMGDPYCRIFLWEQTWDFYYKRYISRNCSMLEQWRGGNGTYSTPARAAECW
jgi:hypothetical protein